VGNTTPGLDLLGSPISMGRPAAGLERTVKTQSQGAPILYVESEMCYCYDRLVSVVLEFAGHETSKDRATD